jgi:beta-lactam-binding protein with PASTA domain
MWRKLLRGLGCLSYVGLLAVIFGLAAYFAFSLFVRGGVTATPEVYGLSQDEAVALLADQGLRASWSEDGEIWDEKVSRGHIVRQEPRAGVYIKRNSDVVLTLSLGPRRLVVPKFEGDALQSVQVSLGAVGLKVGNVFNVFDERAAAGFIVAQSPAAGERLEADAKVDLLISAGDIGHSYVMPDLVKMRYEGVRNFFDRHGFRIGKVSYESYEGVPPGTVLRQFPLAGHPLRRTDVISLDVVAPPGGPVKPSSFAAGAGESR